MLIYGDHSETVDAGLWVEQIRTLLAEARGLTGLERHSKIVGALIESGRLVQGLADAASPKVDRVAEFTYELAKSLVRSWDTGFGDAEECPAAPDIGTGDVVELRHPEGFSHYAIYPEAYIDAARRLCLSGRPLVIGIRSIGTTLGAVAAAATGAPAPVTVRPDGDPLRRRAELPASLLGENLHYVIVDEGPGLSGSSFGSIADWLEDHGIEAERIAFLTSHGRALGPDASARHRKRWLRAQRVSATFEFRFLKDAFGPLEELPAEDPWDRPRFLGKSAGTKVAMRFAGLGRMAERKLQMARALFAEGLTPEPLGLVHGFLVERWDEDGFLLAPEDKPVREIARYIGTRALLFPAPDGEGATIEDLLRMCRRNLSLALGEEEAAAMDRWGAADLRSDIKRIRTDNKLDRGQWLRLADGRLLKTNAVDHHCGHDLIGCQDVAWDVAGAITEFALGQEDTRRLVEETERSALRPLNPVLLGFYRIAYCCFRLGQARLSSEMCSDSGEAGRLASRAAHYETALMPLLKDDYCCFTSHKSSVDLKP